MLFLKSSENAIFYNATSEMLSHKELCHCPLQWLHQKHKQGNVSSAGQYSCTPLLLLSMSPTTASFPLHWWYLNTAPASHMGGCLKSFCLSVIRVRDPGSSSIDGGFQFLPWFPWQLVQKPSPKKNTTQWEQRHYLCIFLWGIVLNVLCYSYNYQASCKKQKARTGWWQK